VRRELREVLREGRAGVGARTGRPLTVLLSTATDTGAEGVLPRDHDVHHLALDPLGPPARAAQEVDVG
jgi:hypothetical protein